MIMLCVLLMDTLTAVNVFTRKEAMGFTVQVGG